MKNYLIYLTFAGLLSSCYYDSEEAVYPLSANCSVTEVSFLNDITPILEQSCNTPSCHNSADRAGNVVLDTHADAMVSVENGSLIGSMRFTGNFSPMPIGQPQLDECTLTLIETWIANGAPNN